MNAATDLPAAEARRSAALDAALAAATERYRAANPKSAAQLERAAEVMPGGNTRTVLFQSPFPPVMVRGRGCRLWTADGQELLDALGEYTAGLYGHDAPPIRHAIVEALGERGLSLSSHTPWEEPLAREIVQRFPSMALLRFTNSGTEANLMALALACVHTGRRSVLAFDGAYHGGVLTFSGGPGPLNVPHRWRMAPYNDLQAAQHQAAAAEGDLAAILVEPMLGSGGCIPGEPEFLHGLRALADRTGAMLIFDEVMTSRLSTGGRQALLGIRPDLTTLGKYFGGGLSFGAFGGRADAMARFDPRQAGALGHAGTFNNNVLSMAAGLAGIQQLWTPAEAQRLNALGDGLRERCNALLREQGVALHFTGLGSLMALHTCAGPVRRYADAQAGDARLRDLLWFALMERGVYMARRGFIALSLPWGEAEAVQFAAALGDALKALRPVLPAAAVDQSF